MKSGRRTHQKAQQTNGGIQIYKGPLDVVKHTLATRGFLGLYRGLSALVIGTATKAGVRFLVFDTIKQLLADSNGKTSGGRLMLAGLGAGVVEAVVAVTPTETIKTKLIQDQNSAKPRYKGLVHGTRTIIAEQGLFGIYQGVTTVIARQGANSAVRLAAYGLMREKIIDSHYSKPPSLPNNNSNGTQPRAPNSVPVYVTFGIGAVAGIITVYTTMPLDVLKTKMQALDAKTLYTNTFDCLLKTVRNDGVLSLWKGATPRLGRLIFSGGIVFACYEEVMKGFGYLDRLRG
ncbi:hypothetical protein HDV05_002933 [Chytridiales sp. JEL 0842]|nr:hypothetical protein HDV05_002933 [Chytridiales sp. JEL 0842]